MRPLAKAVTKTLEKVRSYLREQCLSPTPHYTEEIHENLKIFDRLFSEFEFSYVSCMGHVKTTKGKFSKEWMWFPLKKFVYNSNMIYYLGVYRYHMADLRINCCSLWNDWYWFSWSCKYVIQFLSFFLFFFSCFIFVVRKDEDDHSVPIKHLPSLTVFWCSHISNDEWAKAHMELSSMWSTMSLWQTSYWWVCFHLECNHILSRSNTKLHFVKHV